MTDKIRDEKADKYSAADHVDVLGGCTGQAFKAGWDERGKVVDTHKCNTTHSACECVLKQLEEANARLKQWEG